MERVFAELIRRAHREYHLVVVARELDPDLRALVEWRRVPGPPRPRPLHFLLFYLVGGARLARVRADLVHTLGALVPNRADLASVHFCHAGFHAANDAEERERRSAARRINTRVQRALGLAAERWSYGRGRIASLAAVSEGVAGELRRHYPSLRVVVTPNGVDMQRFRPDPATRGELRRAEGVGEEEIVALFVGSDWEHKGLAIAIEALARARTSSEASLRLWIVGRGDQNRARAQAERWGVADRVRFFGVRSDTERFYKAADVLMLPSRYEAFPLVSLEAAACALPVIATRVNGVSELIGDDEAGFIVDRNSQAFAEALETLTADAGRRVRAGGEARRRASSYTWDRSAESVLQIYRELLGAAPQAKERAA
jgi:glycosyltransferase involved in cell wall biosynthesis